MVIRGKVLMEPLIAQVAASALWFSHTQLALLDALEGAQMLILVGHGSDCGSACSGGLPAPHGGAVQEGEGRQEGHSYEAATPVH